MKSREERRVANPSPLPPGVLTGKPMKSREVQLLAFAKRQAKHCKTWIDLHNQVYGIGGKFVELFPQPGDRAAFAKTPQYREIAELLAGLPRRVDAQPTEGEASGRFIVRMPPSMHAALIAEAEREGVSLNQLCIAKLAPQLKALV
jgi:hypothetical protein